MKKKTKDANIINLKEKRKFIYIYGKIEKKYYKNTAKLINIALHKINRRLKKLTAKPKISKRVHRRIKDEEE